LQRVVQNANARGLAVTLTPDEMASLFEVQEGKCALTGLPIEFGGQGEATTASLDRIDSKKGYVPGNVQWVHKDVNELKMDLPETRLIELCTKILEHRK
jgi:hypothetical protein